MDYTIRKPMSGKVSEDGAARKVSGSTAVSVPQTTSKYVAAEILDDIGLPAFAFGANRRLVAGENGILSIEAHPLGLRVVAGGKGESVSIILPLARLAWIRE